MRVGITMGGKKTKKLISGVGRLLGKNTLHGYSQPNYLLIDLADIRRSYLIYFHVCNMLKILRNKNRLIYCIFHCRMLHLVFINIRFLKNAWAIVWNFA